MGSHRILRDYFGHTAFRPGQEELIGGILGGRDVLGILPTGGGKSLCYQIPALQLRGLTLVISPLISLMKDQVTALNSQGIPAAYLNSTLSAAQQETVFRRLSQGFYKLLYVAPERLETEGFLRAIRGLEIPLAAVDEAHCISQWGQDFRPSYLKITAFLDSLPRRPAVGAFTATATPAVREDIRRILALEDPVEVVTGFDRPNLFFQVLKPGRKEDTLQALIRQRPGRSGIVYCATRSGVEKVCSSLRAAGIAAVQYHAGLSEEERRASQEDFQYDRAAVMVATNAFGMGIDKSNVSFVFHFNMPKSLEAYYQEAGRAGRDGSPAECILLYAAGDVTTARFLLQNSQENETMTPEEREETARQDARRLEAMVGYCRTTDCLRGYILDYFGQTHGGPCGSCGNCREDFREEDITVAAQMILSCVKRVRDHLGYGLGSGLILDVLRGGRSQRVLDLGLDSLSTYGLMKGTPKEEVRELLEHLKGEDCLCAHPRHGSLDLGPRAGDVLFGRVRLTRKVRAASLSLPTEKRSAAPAAEDPLVEKLKALRLRLAQEERIPAYMVFSNVTLQDMAARRPRSMEDFLSVSGVGQKKGAKYGAPFLAAIRDHLEGE